MIVGFTKSEKTGEIMESPLRLQDSQVEKARDMVKKGMIVAYAIAAVGKDGKLVYDKPVAKQTQSAPEPGPEKPSGEPGKTETVPEISDGPDHPAGETDRPGVIPEGQGQPGPASPKTGKKGK